MIERFRGPYYFLSNFYVSTVTWDGETYPTVEHAYQASKFRDPKIRERIRRAETPGRAKALGRTFKSEEGWEASRLAVMRELVRQKFAIPTLGNLLLLTGDEELVEGNVWGDTFWGRKWLGPARLGTGLNHLGLILMEIRGELRRAAMTQVPGSGPEDGWSRP